MQEVPDIMTDTTTATSKYTSTQRALHWLIALMVLGVLAGGLTLGFLGFKGVTELLGETGRNILYNLHKTFGLIILAAMVIRLIVKIRSGTPPYDPPLAPWQSLASKIVHKALYICLIAMPILGWLATDAHDYPVEFFTLSVPQFIDKDKALGDLLYELHETVGWIIVALIATHIGAALMHAIVHKDGVIKRMM